MPAISHDFRSDTVTRPSAGMRRAMAEAAVGDDVFGDDPTVARLEATLADMLGKPAAAFMPSGTQSNLVALLSHCGRGDEYIAGMDAHCYAHEQGGAAWLGSIQPQPIPHEKDGTLALDAIVAAIKPDDLHYARTRLLALENTLGGRVIPLTYLQEAAALARQHGLGTHLDGARMFNAVVAGNVDAKAMAAPFDTVSVCLSKGLGAPVGSVLVGEAELIARAKRHRKALGGGMRQVGLLAAAGLYALEHNIARLAEDHANARTLAEGFSAIEGLVVTAPDTNIVWVKVPAAKAEAFGAHLVANGIAITSGYAGTEQRWVTHLDVGAESVAAALDVARAFFAG
jgi:threonine aldolase